MIELNHLLLFTAAGSSLLLLVQSLRLRASRVSLAAGVVLLVSLIAWLLARPVAGWITAVVWAVLLALPAYRNRRRARRDFPVQPRAITISPAALVLIVLNCIAFGAEIALGGPTNAQALQHLGWLDTDYVIYAHQYWRLLSALFLHYGALHLLVNMFALLVLGPPLEREVGSGLFALTYVVAGLGSSALVVLLTRMGIVQPVELVGASGSVMGVVGAWGGFLLRHRHMPLARRRLRNIIMIVVLQFVFDLVTPRVSMSAHLGGLGVGFLLGLVLSRTNAGTELRREGSSSERHVTRFR